MSHTNEVHLDLLQPLIGPLRTVSLRLFEFCVETLYINTNLLSATLYINLFKGWFDPYVSLKFKASFLMYLQMTLASAVSPDITNPM
jgi:hypothetical protein